jgi:2-oxoglutarate dehydrogenase complex, dehydrogenase (E1) component, and related enzymes
MTHRGRINVLTNIIGKPPSEIYDEFQDRGRRHGVMTSGDVKYHQGFSSSVETPGGITHVVLGFNPSTWRSSTRWSRARCARASGGAATAPATRCCRCCSTATPPSPGRGW